MTENTVFDAFIKLECAMGDIDTARFALASLVEEADPEVSPHVIRCVMSTLSEAAEDAKAGYDILSEELRNKRFPSLAEARPT